MAKKLTDIEKKGLEIVYDDMQKDYAFHKDYWTWEEDKGRGYLIVRKK